MRFVLSCRVCIEYILWTFTNIITTMKIWWLLLSYKGYNTCINSYCEGRCRSWTRKIEEQQEIKHETDTTKHEKGSDNSITPPPQRVATVVCYWPPTWRSLKALYPVYSFHNCSILLVWCYYSVNMFIFIMIIMYAVI